MQPFNTGRFAIEATSGVKPETFVVLNGLSVEERLHILNGCAVGTPLTLYGYYLLCRADHFRPRELELWRQSGDARADAAVNALMSDAGNRHSYSSVAEHILGLSATNTAAAALLEEMLDVPSWVDAERIRSGQRVLQRNLPLVAVLLLDLSLVGGYGVQKINQVLTSTNYLTSDRDTAYRRLLETVQLVLDCAVPGSLEPPGPGRPHGGQGWQTVMAVRLLHAGVRVRLLSSGHWDTAAHGVPINQEDMLVTQLAFSIVPLIGLERAGLTWHLSNSEMEDFLHLWRYIGHLMGVSLGDKVGQMSQTLAGAQTLLESVVSHILEPSDSSRQLVMSTIQAVAYRMPLMWSATTHVAVCRTVAGNEYADASGVPSIDDPALEAPVDDDHPPQL